MKILVVDDEALLVKGIRFNLQNEGYEVITGSDGLEAVQAVQTQHPDLVVLDVMMPNMDGLSACAKIREFSDVPIIMLTAKGDDMDKLIGFDHGADDYLTKPFRLAELRARVAAHLRRSSRTPAHTLERSGVRFDLASKSAAVNGQTLPFTKSEYAICEYLALHAGQTFSKEQIYEAVFGYDGSADDTAVTQHIKNIRAKLRAAGLPNADGIIKTVWGVGYVWQNES